MFFCMFFTFDVELPENVFGRILALFIRNSAHTFLTFNVIIQLHFKKNSFIFKKKCVSIAVRYSFP